MVSPAKRKTDFAKLTELFNEWLDERIIDCDVPALSENHKRLLAERKETFQWVRLNFARIAEGGCK